MLLSMNGRLEKPTLLGAFGTAEKCHGTTARVVGRWGQPARQHDSGTGRPVLKMRSLQPHLRQEHPHDRRGDEPVAPEHDRRHDYTDVCTEDTTCLVQIHHYTGLRTRVPAS